MVKFKLKVQNQDFSFNEYEFWLQEITATVIHQDGKIEYIPVENTEEFIRDLGAGFRIRTYFD